MGKGIELKSEGKAKRRAEHCNGKPGNGIAMMR